MSATAIARLIFDKQRIISNPEFIFFNKVKVVKIHYYCITTNRILNCRLAFLIYKIDTIFGYPLPSNFT